jgi:hypothetical protein
MTGKQRGEKKLPPTLTMTLQMALMLQLVVKTLKFAALVPEVHNTNTTECHWLLTFTIATKRAMNTTGS